MGFGLFRSQELEPGESNHIGKVISVRAVGWLPYTLKIDFRTVESRYPQGFTLEAEGDFEGSGVWSIEERGAWVHVTYDWQIEAKKPLLRLLSPVARPVFAANHRWAMRQGEESLKLELTRRRAATELERALVPPPPRPTTTSSVPLLLVAAGAAGAVLGASLLIARAARPRRRFRW